LGSSERGINPIVRSRIVEAWMILAMVSANNTSKSAESLTFRYTKEAS